MDKERVLTNRSVEHEQPDEGAKNKALPGPRVIASPLIDHKLAGAFADLVSQRWDNWKLSPWMAYLVDVCDESVLPYLADQFNVEGLRGFDITGDEKQQRELIKKSISLHKYLGTPWAVKEACRTIGFPIVRIEEGVTLKDAEPQPNDWARFRVEMEIGEDRVVTEEEIRKLHQFINFYKNERSELVDLVFTNTFKDGPVFNNREENRESLELMNLIVNPVSLLINPDGEARKVAIHTSVPWKVQPTISWNDGTTDQLYVEMTGANEITIHSDYNRNENREAEIEITTPEGFLLGIVHVIQHLKWHNAYSSGYSNAYNWNQIRYNGYSQGYSRAYNTETYVAFSTAHLIIPDTGESVELQIRSNTNWEIV